MMIPTEGGGDDGITIESEQFLSELFADLLGHVGMLKEQCALKILPAVQTGAQNEMAIEKRAGFAKKRE